MKKLKYKYLIIIAVALGLLTTGFLYNLTNAMSNNDCSGNYPNIDGCLQSMPLILEDDCKDFTRLKQLFSETGNNKVGIPFKNINNGIIDYCGASVNTVTDQILDWSKTWQFYANIATWSVFWIAILYPLNKYVLKKK